MTAMPIEQLRKVRVTAPRDVEGLQVFGLMSQNAGGGLAYSTLDEALQGGWFTVNEVSEHGAVPVLMAFNDSDFRVFMMAGEQLVGAKQDRVLNASVLVGPRTSVPIPVSCVEPGRWGYRSHSFRTSGSSSHAVLRASINKQTLDGYRRTGTPVSDQGAVWTEVDRKLDAMSSISSTHALQQAYDDARGRLKKLLRGVPPPAGCSGAVFAVHGRIVGMDLFDRPETLEKLWPKIVSAYGLDALEPQCPGSRAVTAGDVRDWLDSSSALKVESFQSPGLGDDLRLDGPKLKGAALVHEGRAIHIEMFGEPLALAALHPAGAGGRGGEIQRVMRTRPTVTPSK